MILYENEITSQVEMERKQGKEKQREEGREREFIF